MSERTALYRLFDAGRALLYIGITDDVGRRWSQHLKQKTWWPQVHRQTVDWSPDRDTAEAAEVVAIRTELPMHNVRHSALPQTCVDQDDASEGVARITVMGLRRNLADVLGRAAHGSHHVEVTKNGKIAAYVGSPAMFARLTNEDR